MQLWSLGSRYLGVTSSYMSPGGRCFTAESRPESQNRRIAYLAFHSEHPHGLQLASAVHPTKPTDNPTDSAPTAGQTSARG